MGTSDSDWTARRLSEVYSRTPEDPLDLDRARLVVFSDQHRGQGDETDDFRICKRAYHAALGYYFEAGFTLVVLGDVEELWKYFPGPVMHAYPDTLALEREFHSQHRYVRVFGNHDDLWAREKKVRQYLVPRLGDLTVREAVRFEARLGGESLGKLFLVHGHQGTLDSDRYSRLSRWVVRYPWRNLQRLLHLHVNSPATDFEMREAHEHAMYDWAASRAKTVLIAGHTHRPVFESQANATRLELLLESKRAELRTKPGDPTLVAEAAALRAQLEWARATDGISVGGGPPKPCYFNTGCCCFNDGDVTGVEIAGGSIRLVRCPNNAGDPEPQELDSAALSDVYSKL